MTNAAWRAERPSEAGWTRNKPTVAGWYWWRFREGKDPVVMKIGDDHIAKTNVFTIGTSVLLIDELPGEWLGPLSPDDRQQGRVAGLRECLDMLEGEIARDRDSGVLESLRQRMEAKLEECK